MKALLLSGLTLLSVSTFAQETTTGLRDEFAQISKYTNNRQSGFEGLQSFSSKEIRGSQFYFPAWSGGSLVGNANETTAGSFLFLYDKVRQELFMKLKDSATVLQADKSKINGFTLMFNGTTHQFVTAASYDPADKTDFYEVLVKDDSGFSLLKLVKSKLVKFDPTDMVKMKEGDTYDEFQDNISYFVAYNHGVPQPVKLKDNVFKKVLATDKAKVDDFINNHADDERNEDFYVQLVASLK